MSTSSVSHPYNENCRCHDCLAYELDHPRPVSRYTRPDTSDRTDDESWSEYWDRKRIERHGTECKCILCQHGDKLRELGKTLLPEEMREWID